MYETKCVYHMELRSKVVKDLVYRLKKHIVIRFGMYINYYKRQKHLYYKEVHLLEMQLHLYTYLNCNEQYVKLFYDYCKITSARFICESIIFGEY